MYIRIRNGNEIASSSSSSCLIWRRKHVICFINKWNNKIDYKIKTYLDKVTMVTFTAHKMVRGLCVNEFPRRDAGWRCTRDEENGSLYTLRIVRCTVGIFRCTGRKFPDDVNDWLCFYFTEILSFRDGRLERVPWCDCRRCYLSRIVTSKWRWMDLRCAGFKSPRSLRVMSLLVWVMNGVFWMGLEWNMARIGFRCSASCFVLSFVYEKCFFQVIYVFE